MKEIKVYCYPDYIDTSNFSMPFLQRRLAAEGIVLTIVRWDGRIGSLPAEPVVIRYSSRLDMKQVLAGSDWMEGTTYEGLIASENARELEKHAGTDCGSTLLQCAKNRGQLVIYEDRVVHQEEERPHDLPPGNARTFAELWAALQPFITTV